MSRTESPIELALQRMLEADNAERAGNSPDDWAVWQRTATDYWVLLHPDLAR